MSSKIYISLLLIISCFIFVSCNKYEKNRINDEEIGVQTIYAEQDIHKDINENSAYVLINDTYNKGKINAYYPQITHYKDNDKQDTINEAIKNNALKLVDDIEKDEIITTLDIDYSIKRSDDKLLSIQFVEYINSKDAPYPVFLAYTTNINIETGTELKLIDYFKIDTEFVEQYRKGKLNLLKSYQNEAFEDLTDEEILAMFQNAELYLTEDSLGFTVAVPHAVGDFAELEINYKDLTGFIKDDMWIQIQY